MLAPVFALSDDAAGMIVAAIVLPVFGLLLVGLVFVIRDTIRGKGRWGINLKRPACKKCGTPALLVRKPASTQQALWGGWTCAECGFELDKWGAPVPDQPEPAKWKLLEAVEAADVEDAGAEPPSTAVKAPGQVKERDEGTSHD